MSVVQSSGRILVVDDSPTIIKVVELVLTKAGYEVVTAADGASGLTLATQSPPDLILLDFVMPKMNGYQFCREISNHDNLNAIPIVLMSAKGDQVGERFVKVMGIVDYITKPFSPEAITAVVDHTITKYKVAKAEVPTQRELLPVDIDAIENNTDPSVALEPLRARVSQSVAARIATLLSSSQEPGSPQPTEAEIAEAAAAALDDQTITEILSYVDPMSKSLRGDLQVFPIAEVLQLLDTQKQSGVLSVVGQGTIEVAFRNGQVDLATATAVPEEFLLGRFIVETELMTRQDLDAFLDSRGETRQLIGQQLVKLGYVTDTDLQVALARQTNALIYEALRWRYGQFVFNRHRAPPQVASEAQLGLDVEGILLEGYRRVDEWHLIEREITDFELIFLRNEDTVAHLGKGSLSRDELSVLELINGKNSVKAIVRRSHLGSFEVSKMLFRLLSTKLIRKRVTPVAV